MRLRYTTGPLGLFLVLLVGSLPALSQSLATSEQVSNQTSPRALALLAQSFATERTWVWQRRLNLQDWKISVQLARTGDLRPKTMGNIRWDAEKKSAVIRVLHPSDYQLPLREMLEDVEFTVVHELLHLELSSLPRSDASRSEEEHAVNRIARALLDLDRKP